MREFIQICLGFTVVVFVVARIVAGRDFSELILPKASRNWHRYVVLLAISFTLSAFSGIIATGMQRKGELDKAYKKDHHCKLVGTASTLMSSSKYYACDNGEEITE